jgi:hypothetical protein
MEGMEADPVEVFMKGVQSTLETRHSLLDGIKTQADI